MTAAARFSLCCSSLPDMIGNVTSILCINCILYLVSMRCVLLLLQLTLRPTHITVSELNSLVQFSVLFIRAPGTGAVMCHNSFVDCGTVEIVIQLEARLLPNIGFTLWRFLAFLDFRPP